MIDELFGRKSLRKGVVFSQFMVAEKKGKRSLAISASLIPLIPHKL